MLSEKKPYNLRRHLIRGAAGSLALKIANTVLTLLMAVVLARVLGVENFGVYAFCLSVVNILTVPAMLGGQQLLVREVAAYQAKGDFHFLRGLLTRFRQASFLASIGLALIAAGIGYLVYHGSHMLVPFLVATAIIPLYTAIRLQGAALRGLKHVLLGQAAQVIRPALVIVIVGGIFWLSSQRLEAEVALSAQLTGSALLVCVTFILLRRLLPMEVKNAQPSYETSKWIKSALPFVFANGMQILNRETSILMLGILQEPEEVGLFRVAQRGALLIPFGLHAVSTAVAPTVSQMFVQDDKKHLQSIINKSILGILAFALPVTLGLMLGGKWIISVVFGSEYMQAYLPLLILCVGQLINAGMGFVGLILNMANLERITALGVALAACFSVLLNIILVPYFSIIGAAIATSVSLIAWNILLFIWLYKKTGIKSTVIPMRKNDKVSK